jgi:site-specific recombinase XerD
VLEGIARVHGAALNKKTALLNEPLLELVDRMDTGATAGIRDRALLLLGFAVDLRRLELVALTVEDPSPHDFDRP